MKKSTGRNLTLDETFIISKRFVTPRKPNMTMENEPFADVSPIKNGDFPMSCMLVLFFCVDAFSPQGV